MNIKMFSCKAVLHLALLYLVSGCQYLPYLSWGLEEADQVVKDAEKLPPPLQDQKK